MSALGISMRFPSAIERAVDRAKAVKARREPLPRPPAYVVLLGTVVVLNIVGLVMILSASAVQALSAYGSSWYFFERQLMWSVVGGIAFFVAARVHYRHWRKLSIPSIVISAVTFYAELLPGVGLRFDGT